MKKTIAILLVLVIAMAGVFAGDATLEISTTVAVVDQLIITNSATHTFSNNSGLAQGLTSSVDLDGWDNTNAAVTAGTDTGSVIVGYVHGRTNRNAGFKVSVLANPLSMTETGTDVEGEPTSYTYYIPYILKAGAVNANINNTAVSPADLVLHVASTDGQAWTSDSESIAVTLAEKFDSYRSGTYEADIVFTIAAY